MIRFAYRVRVCWIDLREKKKGRESGRKEYEKQRDESVPSPFTIDLEEIPSQRSDGSISNRRCRLVDAEFRLIKNRLEGFRMIVNESESWNRGGNFIEPFRSGRIELGRGKQGGGRGEEATSKYIHHAASIILQRMLVIEGNVGFRSSDSRHPTPITCYRSRNQERRIDTWFRFS